MGVGTTCRRSLWQDDDWVKWKTSTFLWLNGNTDLRCEGWRCRMKNVSNLGVEQSSQADGSPCAELLSAVITLRLQSACSDKVARSAGLSELSALYCQQLLANYDSVSTRLELHWTANWENTRHVSTLVLLLHCNLELNLRSHCPGSLLIGSKVCKHYENVIGKVRLSL